MTQLQLLYLRSQPTRVVGNTGEDTIEVCIRAQHAAEVEVNGLHPPVLVNQQVWICMENGRVVVLQLQHALQDSITCL